jgi:hypothetical protein
MPSNRPLSALYDLVFTAISGLAGRLLVLAHRLRILSGNLRLSGASPARRLPLGFAAAGLVAVIGLTAGPVTPAAAATNLVTISNIGPAVAAGHVGDALFAPEVGQHPVPVPAKKPAPRPAPSKPAQSKPAPKPAQQKPAPKPAPKKQASHPAKARLAVKEHKKARPAHRRVHHATPRPYTIYDSIHPSAIPGHKVVATYATGNYAAQPSEVAGSKSVMWIDITGRDYAASVLDVEPGDATPVTAAEWARHRLSSNSHVLARIYTMRSEWGAVQSAVSSLKKSMRDRIRWWIADPTGVPHIVPGSSATQWYWGPNYDVTTANPDF